MKHRENAPPRRASRTPIAATTLAVILVSALVWAHDDAKEDEMGPPVRGRGLTGEILLPDADGKIDEFRAKNVALLSWLTSRDLAGSPQRVNDVWGYVDRKGREYAIVGLLTGTAFVDVTDPVNPEPVAMIPGAPSTWRDMAVYKKVAYSVNETGNGIQVIDLRRIHRGKVRLRREVTRSSLRTSHNISVNEASGYAYLSGSNLAGGGLVAVDLEKPLKPVIEPVAWGDAYVHDVLVVTYDEGPYAGREVAFAFAGRDGLQILDVTDKTNIFRIAELRYPGLAYCHSGWLSENRRFLYLNDELDEREGQTRRTTTHVIDVEQLEDPRFLRAATNGQTSIDHNTMVRGRFLFAANYTSGLRIFDVKRGRRPREVGYFDTHPETDAPLFSGAWGVFAGFPSGVVLISDIERGLFILF